MGSSIGQNKWLIVGDFNTKSSLEEKKEDKIYWIQIVSTLKTPFKNYN